MSTRKTNKSLTKRIKITRKGKLITETPGRNHYNAKASGQSLMKKRAKRQITLTKKAIARELPHS